MSSGILQKYYTHTKEGQNKDYRMVINFSDLTLECHWGPIGGTKQIDRYKKENMTELTDLINEKHLRRIDHGYIDDSEAFRLASVEVSGDFASEIADLIAAERLGV